VIEIYVDRTAAVASIETWRLGLSAVLAVALGAAFGGFWRWGRSARTRVNDLRTALREARRRDHQHRRAVETAGESAVSLLAQAGTELVAPIQALLARGQAGTPEPPHDDAAGPLSPASLHLLGLRVDALAALAPDRWQAAGPREAQAASPTLAEIVAEVIAARQTQARASRCEVTAHVDPRVAERRLPDARRLRDVLELLLASAITQSPGAGVQLKLTARPGSVDIDLTDSTRVPAERSDLDRLIATRLCERLGASLRTRFTPGVGRWHHLRVALAASDVPGGDTAARPER
jgi:hypothetical protein